MNDIEHLLTKLSEECVEVSKEVHKALCFGLDDRYKREDTLPLDKIPSVREKLVDELNDLAAVIKMAVDARILPENWQDETKQAAKCKKVLKYMLYAERVGTLQP